MSGPVDAEALARLVREYRAERGMSLRAAADEAGMPFNTLSRMERGHLPDLANFVRAVTWIGRDPAAFLPANRPTRSDSTTDVIRAALHADPLLDEAAAEQIAGLVAQLYGTLAARPRLVTHVQVASTFVPRAAELVAELLDRVQAAVDGGDFEPGWAS